MTRRVKTHIRLGIRSVSPSCQCPHCPHEETLGPYLPIAKFGGISLAEFLRELSGSFSAKFRGETLGEIRDFYFFSPRKNLFNEYGRQYGWVNRMVITTGSVQ